jgi:hypothetical protein
MITSFARTVGFASCARVLLSAALVSSTVTDAGAQEPAGARDGWIVGPLIGVPGVGTEAFTEAITLGVGATRLVPNRPGVDLALGVVPRFIGDGAIVLGARVGLGLPLALSNDLFVVPSAGLSALGGFGGGGGGGTAGFYGGVATVLAVGSMGFRAGVTWHRFGSGDGNLWLAELGMMHVPLPSAWRSSSQ